MRANQKFGNDAVTTNEEAVYKHKYLGMSGGSHLGMYTASSLVVTTSVTKILICSHCGTINRSGFGGTAMPVQYEDQTK